MNEEQRAVLDEVVGHLQDALRAAGDDQELADEIDALLTRIDQAFPA